MISEAKPTDLLWSPAGPRTVSYTLGAAGSATEKLDQYAGIDGLAATWDANGNRSSLNGLATTHDAENRLVAASKSGMSVGYVYDASGRRLMKDFVSGGSDTVFVAAGDMEIAEYDASGVLLRRYVPGLKTDDRIAMIEATGAIAYYHPDRLGNVVMVTDPTGVASDIYKYTPFGIEEPLALSGNPYRYTGQRFDPETGLYYYRARYYDPSDTGGGRFLETDPVGYTDQMNLYGYVGNDPVNGTDPSGEFCTLVNQDGEFCNRSRVYAQYDDLFRKRTRFFAAASATMSMFADLDIPTSNWFSQMSGGSEKFLRAMSGDLESVNRNTALELASNRNSGPNLDAALVHREQSVVQAHLDKLRRDNPDAYSKVVSDVNKLLNIKPGEASFQSALANAIGSDKRYQQVLAQVRKKLGRNIQFENQKDREEIGNQLIDSAKSCYATGSYINKCNR